MNRQLKSVVGKSALYGLAGLGALFLVLVIYALLDDSYYEVWHTHVHFE